MVRVRYAWPLTDMPCDTSTLDSARCNVAPVCAGPLDPHESGLFHKLYKIYQYYSVKSAVTYRR